MHYDWFCFTGVSEHARHLSLVTVDCIEFKASQEILNIYT